MACKRFAMSKDKRMNSSSVNYVVGDLEDFLASYGKKPPKKHFICGEVSV